MLLRFCEVKIIPRKNYHVKLLKTEYKRLLTRWPEIEYRECEYCGETFSVGGMSGKRSSRQYCKDAHRIKAFKRRKREKR